MGTSSHLAALWKRAKIRTLDGLIPVTLAVTIWSARRRTFTVPGSTFNSRLKTLAPLGIPPHSSALPCPTQPGVARISQARTAKLNAAVPARLASQELPTSREGSTVRACSQACSATSATIGFDLSSCSRQVIRRCSRPGTSCSMRCAARRRLISSTGIAMPKASAAAMLKKSNARDQFQFSGCTSKR